MCVASGRLRGLSQFPMVLSTSGALVATLELDPARVIVLE
jgi:hypothetical protein